MSNSKTTLIKCQKAECERPGTLRCSRCKNVNYCSKECQTSDWKEHKKQCKKSKEGERKPTNEVVVVVVGGGGCARSLTTTKTDDYDGFNSKRKLAFLVDHAGIWKHQMHLIRSWLIHLLTQKISTR